MFDRHTIIHAALCAVHAMLAIILLLEGSVAHAMCTAVMAALYGFLCRLPPRPQEAPGRKDR